MPRIIKLTKQQLKETDNGDFDYIDDENDMPSRIGQSQISVDGKVDDTESGDTLIGDRIAKTMTPQTYSRFNNYSNGYCHRMREGVDVNKDNVDDFYNNDNLIKIPQGVDYKTNMLVDAMNNLNPKQQAIVVNKILENVNMNSIPYSWKKELIMKLLSNNKIK